MLLHSGLLLMCSTWATKELRDSILTIIITDKLLLKFCDDQVRAKGIGETFTAALRVKLQGIPQIVFSDLPHE